MKKIKFYSLKIITGLFFLILITACNNDDNGQAPPEPNQEEENNEEKEPDEPRVAGKVEMLSPDLVYDGYILMNDVMNHEVYLMDKNANVVYEWDLGNRSIGNDAVLQEDGNLLAALRYDESEDIVFGGYGGRIQLMDKEGTPLWDFTYATSEHRTHHDIERLPNGNILAIAWERIPQEQATENGSTHDMDLYLESVIEIDPNTDDIVWEWHSIDHVIQDVDDTKLNYGPIKDNPQLININLNSNDTGNLMHINGIEYDSVNDLIYLSVNFYSEIWVIDHSTDTATAASHTGGNFGKGGDLVYRFGNPAAYNDQESERLFFNNHHPNLFEPGKFLIFSNGGDLEQSTVYEMQLPDALNQQSIPENTAPEVIWSFTDPDLYGGRVSGAVRLPNGNTMITEGDYGIWEVTTEGEVVWKFSSEGFFWRSYHYDKDHPGVIALDL